MVSILTSPSVKLFFSTIFKTSDVNGKLNQLNDYLVKNYRTENQRDYRTSARTGALRFTSNYSLRGGEVLVTETDDREIVKLAVIYLTHVDKTLSQKSVYRPENLFSSLDWRREALKWKDYIDKDLNSFLSDNKDLDCTYTEEDIKNHYKGISDNRALTLYRMCNSLGRLVDTEELNSESFSSFNIDTSKTGVVIGESLSTSKLFRECVDVFRHYQTLVSSRPGMAKLEASRRVFDIYFSCLKSHKDLSKIKSNPLVLAKFMLDFDRLTLTSRGFSDNYRALRTMTPIFRRFIIDVFLINFSLDEDALFFKLPKASVVEILDEPGALSQYMSEREDFSTRSTVNTLPLVVDDFMTDLIVNDLKPRTQLTRTQIIDGMLFILAKNTTNVKQLLKDEIVSCDMSNARISFNIGTLVGRIYRKVFTRYPTFKGMNIFRMWANKRADRALSLFRLCGFNPGLFPATPKILPYMRFDFYKALSLGRLSDDEVESFKTLRVMTEKKSNNNLESDLDSERWIFRN
nr:59.8 kDa protein [Jasmine virus A-1]